MPSLDESLFLSIYKSQTLHYLNYSLYWCQRAKQWFGHPSPMEPGAFNGHDKDERLPDELGVSKSAFNTLTLLVGRQEEHPAC